MRSVITEISSRLFGLSVLIFILALLIPLIRESPSPEGKNDTSWHELSSTLKKTIERLEPKRTKSPVIDAGSHLSITQLQDEAMPNQASKLTKSNQSIDASDRASRDMSNDTTSNQNQGELSVTQPLQIPSELAIPQSEKKSIRSADPSIAEEKRSSQHELMSLLVLDGDFFPSGQATPSANVHEAIDKIIPLIQMRSVDNVVVEGHADKRITDGINPSQISTLNKIISLQRANAVALMLVQKGVASDRIMVRGLGDAVPLASNLTHEGRVKNRRVEIKLLPAQ